MGRAVLEEQFSGGEVHVFQGGLEVNGRASGFRGVEETLVQGSAGDGVVAFGLVASVGLIGKGSVTVVHHTTEDRYSEGEGLLFQTDGVEGGQPAPCEDEVDGAAAGEVGIAQVGSGLEEGDGYPSLAEEDGEEATDGASTNDGRVRKECHILGLCILSQEQWIPGRIVSSEDKSTQLPLRVAIRFDNNPEA